MYSDGDEWFACVTVEFRFIGACFGDPKAMDEREHRIRYLKDLRRASARFGVRIIAVCLGGNTAQIFFGQTYEGEIETVLRYANSSFSAAFRGTFGRVSYRKNVIYVDVSRRPEEIFLKRCRSGESAGCRIIYFKEKEKNHERTIK